MTRGKVRLYSLIVVGALLFSINFVSFGAGQTSVDNIKGTPAGWSDDIPLSDYTLTNQWCSIASYNEDVHVVWVQDVVDVLYNKSNDEGGTWGTTLTLNHSNSLAMYPDIDASGQNIHTVWEDRDGWDTIYYRNSTDGGDTWNLVKRISETGTNANARGAKIFVNNSNTHIIWADYRDGVDGEIYYRRSLDGGITFDDGQGVDQDRRVTFSPAPIGNNRLAGFESNLSILWSDERDGDWEIYWMISKDNGFTWEDGLGTPNVGRKLSDDTSESLAGGMAVNGSKIHIIWVDETWPGPEYRLYYRNSTDNGLTWNPSQLLTGPSPGIVSPDIDVVGDQVHVVWDDERDDGVHEEIYYKNSTDGGITWSGDLRLTYNLSREARWPRISVENDTKHIVWWDQISGVNHQIMYKRFPDFPTDTTPPTITHTPITESPINQPIEILANITDDFEVSNVTLYYQNVGETTYMAVDMTLISGDWTATIPAQIETGLIHYFIWANDTSGNNITSPVMGDYAVQITGSPSIEIINPNGGEVWTGGSNHQIEFTASDTEDATDVLDVFLNYTYNGEAITVEINQTTGDSSPYIWTLPFLNATDVKINATVIDSDGNKAYDNSSIFTIDSTPPEVVSTNPANNTTGISIFQPVVIQFDEKMNVSSVIVNQTNGTDPGGWSWFWNEDKDMITGIHDAWQRGDVVEISVQENFSDDSDPGNANNTAFVFSFTTEINPSPEIVHTNVSDAQELGDTIRINATITDDGQVMNAVLWWQDVDDVWHENYMNKDGDYWEFNIPGQMVEGSVSYQINATDDLQQKNTTIIYEFDIEDTTSPVIIHTPVESAVIDYPINITCQVSDLGGIDVVYLHYRNESEVNFTRLAINPGYWYELAASSLPVTIEYYIIAIDQYGNEASTGIYSLKIIDPAVPDTTPPEVLFTTPTGDDIPISTDISIVFSEAMNQTTVEGAITISPTITGISYNWMNNQTLILSFDDLQNNTTYTVTINSGADDLAGNTLVNDYSWQFSTVEEPEIAEPPTADNWGWIGIIILLITIIMLLLLHQFNKDKKKEEERQ